MSDITTINIIVPPPQVVKINVSTNRDPIVIKVTEAVAQDSGGGGDGLTEVTGEEHTGLSTTNLTLAQPAIVGTLKLSKNGSRLIAAEFTHPGGTGVILTTVPVTTDVFTADYKY